MTIGRLHVRLDVDYPDNPKIIAAGPMAEVLFVRCLCLAKKMLTHGVIEPVQLSRTGLPNVEKLAKKLVEVGLWKPVKKGYKIVGWLDRNPSVKEIRDLSKTKSLAGIAGGRASGQSRAASSNGNHGD